MAHDVKAASVVKLPHVRGVETDARGPLNRCSFSSLKASWGALGNTVVMRPVLESSLTSPASLTSTPVTGSSTTM